MAVLAEKVRALEADAANWITRAEFTPVRLIVYGMTALMLTGIMGAIIALVLKGAPGP